MWLKWFHLSLLIIFHFHLSTCQVGKSLVLNGCTDYLEIAETDLLDYNDVLSIECWIAPNCDNLNRIIIGKEWCVGEMSYYLSVFDGKLFWLFSESGGCTSGTSWFQSVEAVVPSGQFTHVAVVHDQSEVNLFVNGKKVDSEYIQGSYRKIFNSNEEFRIGAYKFASGDFGAYFSGLIDDLRVWSIPLTEELIQANINAPLTGNENGLILYLDMESASSGSGIVLNNQANIPENLSAISGGYTSTTPYFIESSDYSLNPLDIEEEYTICDNDLILDLGNNTYKSILWSTGSQNASISISSSGTYSVSIETDLCKFYSSTFEVIVLDIVFEEENLFICSEDTYEYQGQLLSPNTSEEFFLPSVSGCDTTLTINVFELPDEELSFLGNDITTCNSSVILSSPFASTIWNGGDEANELLVGEQGIYFADATDSLGCTFIDSIYVSFESLTKEVSVTVCKDDIYVYNGELLSPSSSYQFLLESVSGCDTVLTINVIDEDIIKIFDAEAITVCQNEIILTSPFDSTIWNDEIISQNFNVKMGGYYFAEAYDTNGCLVRDTIFIEFLNQNVYFPNVISKKSTINNCFKPYFSDSKSHNYTLIIFDRWGNLIFSENGSEVEWCGYYENMFVENGVYTYILELNNQCNSKPRRIGTLSVI